MTLPLPHVIVAQPETGQPVDAEAIQENFDAIKKQFPLSRKDLKLMTPIVVGAAGAPAFQNSWVNFDTATYTEARFWKDAMGLVHIEGLIKNGAAAPSTIFTLPAGYLPGGGNGHMHVVWSNTGIARLEVAPTGNVIVQAYGAGGSNAFVSLEIPPFKQEA